jgi:hypothetical protein
MNNQILTSVKIETSKSKYKNKEIVNKLIEKVKGTTFIPSKIEYILKYVESGLLYKNEYKRAVKMDAEIKKHIKNVVKLEMHTFAPELNKLHFKNNISFNIKGLTTIESALIYLIGTNRI